MMTQPSTLEPYRLPWSLNDNVLGWLEPTKRCNLVCEGCYSRNDPKSDKSLDTVRRDLEVFVAKRKMDSISIAGGDPLIHPDIVEIVRMIRRDFGLKPVINTNGIALDEPLLHALKDAGIHGFTFHVDSTQHRPYWKNKTEAELCDLRLSLAEMVAKAGDLSVAFNATITRRNLQDIPMLLDWAARHIDIVHNMVFILFRTGRSAEYEYLCHGAPIALEELTYLDQDKNPEPLTAPEVMEVIRGHEPSYRPAAFLGGTHDPKSFKWTIAGRVGTRGHIHGYVGPRFMELTQTAHHAVFGRYLAYSHPDLLRHGRSMLALSALDQGIARTGKAWLGHVARRPWKAKDRLHFQSVLIIQPIDMMKDGSMNMCDGCPDMTVHDGELVWSCRLDERLQHGVFLTARPREAGEAK